MSWLVQPRLVNEPFGDPGVYIDFRFGRRALLFDLGDLGPLSAREVLRVSHAFVSHAHVDHLAGFDRLLRLCLHRPEPLHLVGPPGFIERIEHKLHGYTWNLLGADSVDFRIRVEEFHGDRIERAASFRAREAFRRADLPPDRLPPGTALEDEGFRITAATLDHGTPSLAFALRETLRVNVLRGALAGLGLPVGRWLNDVKRAVRVGASDETPIAVPSSAPIALGNLKRQALRIAPGQTVAYVTDAAFHPANVARIVELARDADQLFIETPFLEENAALAAGKRHLTAAQAGRIGRQAGARRLIPFHFSARYGERPDLLAREAARAFAGDIEDRRD
jgi:ribonuclease Z